MLPTAIVRSLLAALLAGAAAAQTPWQEAGGPGVPASAPPPMRPAVVVQAVGDQAWLDDVGRPATPSAALPSAGPPPLPPVLADVVCSTTPAAIPAGGTGVLHITIVLHDLAVVRADSPLTFEPLRAADGVAYGSATVVSSAHAKARGLPGIAVHDETMVTSVPIRVADDAAPGPRTTAVQGTVELHDGDAGRSLGRFRLDGTAGFTVGVAVPVPAAIAAAAPTRAPSPAPASVPDAPRPEVVAPPPVPPEGDALAWTLLATGVLLLALGSLVARHRA